MRLVKSEKAVSDQSVLFDEVIGGILQRALRFVFYFAVLEIATRRRVLSMTATTSPAS